MDAKSKQDRILLELQLILKTTKQIEENIIKSIELMDGEEKLHTSIATFDASIVTNAQILSKVIKMLENIDDDNQNEVPSPLNKDHHDIDQLERSNHSDEFSITSDTSL